MFLFLISFFQIKNNKNWLKIFYHNSSNGIYFNNLNETLNCNTEFKYSILYKINSSFKINGKFEFLLEYPELFPNYNHWTQVKNPLETFEIIDGNNDLGYEPIHIDWDAQYWGGLITSSRTSNTLLDGSVGNIKWHYSIGAINKDYYPKFPGPGIYIHEVILWIRIPNFINSKNYQKFNFKIFGIISIIYFII